MKPTKENMYKWYVEERKSYRQIMNIIGTKNNRKIKKLLDKYNIKPRGRSEAIKNQWEDNPERRKQQAEVCKGNFKGNTTNRLSLKEIKNRLTSNNLKFLKREIKNNKSYIKYICKECGYKNTSTLDKEIICVNCRKKEISEGQRHNYKKVKGLFEKNNLILITKYYKNNNQTLKFICKNHKEKGIQTTTYNNLLKKKIKGCVYCSYDNQTSKESTDRKNWRYREWRNKVYKRDNYTCQKCGDNTGGNLEAHHILNYSEYKDKRYNVDNGITFCEKCHNPIFEGSFHNKYGTRDNTKEQLNEFLK